MLFYTTEKINLFLRRLSTEANIESFVVQEKNKKLIRVYGTVHSFVRSTRNLLILNETMQGFVRKLRNLPIVYETIDRFV